MFSIIRAYCPVGTDTQAIRHLMLAEGGYTTYAACGHWAGPAGKVISEDVEVYECVMAGVCGFGPREKLERAGLVYLNDNRKEQAFLGVVIGERVQQVYLTQERT